MTLLVACGNRAHGSTQEVAEAVAERLRAGGRGGRSPPRGGRRRPDAVRRRRPRGARCTSGAGTRTRGAPFEVPRGAVGAPLAVFALGPKTAEQKDLADASHPAGQGPEARPRSSRPRSVAVFGGVIDPSKLRFPLNRLPASDARDWDAIRRLGKRSSRRRHDRRGTQQASGGRQYGRSTRPELEPLIGRTAPLVTRRSPRRPESLTARPVGAEPLNSTATGGGVAEMLQTLLAYGRGAGLDIRRLVIRAIPTSSRSPSEFTTVSTAHPATEVTSVEAERRHYERILRTNADELRALVPAVRCRPDPRSPARRSRRSDGHCRRQGRLALPRRRRQSRTSGPSAPGRSCAVPRRGRRVRILEAGLRALTGPTTRACM